MEKLIFVCMAYIFSYHCCEIALNFRGSSASIRLLYSLIGNICRFASLGLFVWLFWHFAWWQPIVAFVASILIGAVSAIFFQRHIVGMWLSPVLAMLSVILSVIWLL